MRLTKKQHQIMEVIMKGNVDEENYTISWVDLDQLVERVPYQTSKDSIMFSIRALIGKGLIKKGARELRRGRIRGTLVPTELAFDVLRRQPSASVSEYDGIVELF